MCLSKGETHGILALSGNILLLKLLIAMAKSLGNTRTICGICSKVTIKTPERRQ